MTWYMYINSDCSLLHIPHMQNELQCAKGLHFSAFISKKILFRFSNPQVAMVLFYLKARLHTPSLILAVQLIWYSY